MRLPQQRGDLPLVVVLVHGVDLAGEAQRQAGPAGHLDGRLRPLLPGDARAVGQVAPAAAFQAEEGIGQPVMDGRRPVERQPGQRLALGVADGHQRHVVEMGEQRDEVGQVQPSVQGVQRGHLHQAAVGEGQVVEVEVDQVELAGPLVHLGQLQRVPGEGVRPLRVEAQRPAAGGHQLGAGRGVAAGEEGDAVAAADQFLGEVVDHPFRPAVEDGRHGLDQRRDLGDSQSCAHFFLWEPPAGRPADPYPNIPTAGPPVNPV